MSEVTTFVGMDVHKDSIQVALLPRDGGAPVEWTLRNDDKAARRLAKRFAKESADGPMVSCYEAGPTGYTLQRELHAAGIHCRLIAPSLIPVKPGERIKTDRRDARKLAELLRAGVLTEVHPPSPAEESVRDLCRSREDAKEDQTRCRHRLQKFLLRRGRVYRDGKNWTRQYHEWLRTLRWDRTADQVVFDDYLLALEHVGERLRSLEAALASIAQQAPYAEPVAHLRCFRGIDTVTAMTLIAELHGFMRFHEPRQLMAYLGLVPSEHSSGTPAAPRRRGSITKTGNGHVRRVLVEAAKHYRHKPHVGMTLRKRREGQPGGVIAIADKAQQRLHRRYWQLSNQGKPHNKATVAVARELVGFVWVILYGHPALAD